MTMFMTSIAATIITTTITGITITVDKGQHLVPLERDIMFVAEQLAQAVHPHQIGGQQRHSVLWKTGQQRWYLRHRLLLTLPYGSCQGVIRQLALGEDAIDDQLLIGKADSGQFVMGTRYFPQGRGLRPSHQNKPGFPGI